MRTPAPCIRMSAVVGHRGAAAVAPENTLAGLRAAAASGVRWVEVDAQSCADGGLFLMHDDDVSRTTDGRGLVWRMSSTKLRECRVGGAPVPSLSEAMKEARALGLGVNVEIKTPAFAEPERVARTGRAVARLLSEYADGVRVLASGFDQGALAAARAASPDLPLAWNVDAIPGDWRDVVDRLGACAVHCLDAPGNHGVIPAVLASGHGVGVYTVNDLNRARALWAMGVWSVFADDPGALVDKSPDAGVAIPGSRR
ncbi:MAG: glycerophosphodiester phosphodiesterase [Alphaproteobacteria bacterium]|nr:glycerophosphodiester phosphodiesterase [Alphaproteobacteria bacterium]MBF0249859.1 glycerophosphodiester phosphodiesterase [Alphaproteobacteria bacterium]